MFQHKYLKQLRNVQLHIKALKSDIAKLHPPKPDSFEVSRNLYHWLTDLFGGLNSDMNLMYSEKFVNPNIATCDYIRKLGEYFINTANYHELKLKYDTELNRLIEEERRLKEKLGID